MSSPTASARSRLRAKNCVGAGRRSTSGNGPSGGPKAVFVVRGELRLTPGKVAVQVAHAAVMLYQAVERRDRALLQRWLDSGQKKIAVVATTLEELEQLQRRARGAGLTTVVVEDAGLTEVAPGTRTVLGVGPGSPQDVDRITGSLPLL